MQVAESLVGERRLQAVQRHVGKPRTSVTELTVHASHPTTHAHRSAVLAASGSVPSLQGCRPPSPHRTSHREDGPHLQGLTPPRHSVLSASPCLAVLLGISETHSSWTGLGGLCWRPQCGCSRGGNSIARW